MGTEGNAREEIIKKALKQGFVRIRRYKNWWSITVNNLDTRTKKNLSNWAELAKEDKSTGGYFPVKIYLAGRDKMVEPDNINSLYFGIFESKDTALKPISFSEFINN